MDLSAKTFTNQYLRGIRLFNSKDEEISTELRINGCVHSVSFGAFEVKAFIINGSAVKETNLIGR